MQAPALFASNLKHKQKCMLGKERANTGTRYNFRLFLTDSFMGDQLLVAPVAFSCPAFLSYEE
jgi:hypothetical protein